MYEHRLSRCPPPGPLDALEAMWRGQGGGPLTNAAFATNSVDRAIVCAPDWINDAFSVKETVLASLKLRITMPAPHML